jgi:hypothetical protein
VSTHFCRPMRLSVRHLSGLIYDAVDDFVRGPNVTGPTKRNHSPQMRMRSQPETPPEHSLSQFSRQLLLVRSEFPARCEATSERTLTVDDLCGQRNLANAALSHSSGRDPGVLGGDLVPLGGDLVGCAARHLQLQHPVPLREPRARIPLLHRRAFQRRARLPWSLQGAPPLFAPRAADDGRTHRK